MNSVASHKPTEKTSTTGVSAIGASQSGTPDATVSPYRDRWLLRAAPLLALGIILTMLLLVRPGNSTFIKWVIEGGPLLAALVSASVCFFVAARTTTQRSSVSWPWLLMGTALLFFALGHGLYHYVHNAQRLKPGTATVADLFRVLQEPFIWGSLVLLVWPQLQGSRRSGLMRLLSDTLIVVLAVLVLAWIVLLQPIYEMGGSGLQKSLLLFYPLSKIVHLFLALVLFSAGLTRPALARTSSLLMLGLLFFVIAGLTHSYQVLNADSRDIIWLSTCWVWGCLLIGTAALLHSREPENGTAEAQGADAPVSDAATVRTALRLRRYVIVVLPYVATLGVCLCLIWFEYKRGNIPVLSRLIPVLALLLAIVTRQMLTLQDNVQLSQRLHGVNDQLAGVNADLERNVNERTRHLATLHGITSTLNTSLDRRTVLRVTLEKTMMAVGAQGGGIWLRGAREDAAVSTLPLGEEGRPERVPGAGEASWILVHSHGFGDNHALRNTVRDMAVTAAEDKSASAVLTTERHIAGEGDTLSEDSLILVPIRWQGSLMGTMGLVRREGRFSMEDRALVESVALEAGTSLQNARLYYDARHRADRDSVTNLLNHRAAQEQLNDLLKLARGKGGVFSIVMMDLNNFKFFNDTYGHPVGDQVLRTVAYCLREVCRDEDILGRYGGDEFIAILPSTDENGARMTCRRIAGALDRHHFEAEPGSRIPINMSFGWSSFPHDGDSVLDLLTRADTSLYDNKRSGGAAIQLPKNAEITNEVRNEMRQLKNRSSGGSFGVLDALVTAIDNKDHYTRRHSEEVTHMALLIAKELEYSEEALRAVRISGLLHDVGKIAVPDEVLRHPGNLNPEAWNIMKQHPVFGALIVKDLPHLDEVLGGVRHHHERWDGKGYPDGLAETAIPALGRLLAVPDCYSAMTTDRPYRKAFTPQAALAEIEKSIGTQFDPLIANAFIRVMRRELARVGEPMELTSEPLNVDTINLPARANSA